MCIGALQDIVVICESRSPLACSTTKLGLGSLAVKGLEQERWWERGGGQRVGMGGVIGRERGGVCLGIQSCTPPPLRILWLGTSPYGVG